MLIFYIKYSNIVVECRSHYTHTYILSFCLSCHLYIMPSVSLELALLEDPEILIEWEWSIHGIYPMIDCFSLYAELYNGMQFQKWNFPVV